MAWEIKGDLIMDGQKLVGSIVGHSHGCRVEILWSARGGDLSYPKRGACATRLECEAFVRGAEQMLQRWHSIEETEAS